ncbi:hypothetical protein D3C75_1029400 [compost metagenome]
MRQFHQQEILPGCSILFPGEQKLGYFSRTLLAGQQNALQPEHNVGQQQPAFFSAKWQNKHFPGRNQLAAPFPGNLPGSRKRRRQGQSLGPVGQLCGCSAYPQHDHNGSPPFLHLPMGSLYKLFEKNENGLARPTSKKPLWHAKAGK